MRAPTPTLADLQRLVASTRSAGIDVTAKLTGRIDDVPPADCSPTSTILHVCSVLTTFENDDYVFDALRAGASGFLLKRARPDEVVRAIRLLAAGDSLLFPAAIRELAALQTPAEGSGSGLDSAGLTDREAQVLRLIAQGLSNAEIAAQLIVSAETVKTHVAHVLTNRERRAWAPLACLGRQCP